MKTKVMVASLLMLLFVCSFYAQSLTANPHIVEFYVTANAGDPVSESANVNIINNASTPVTITSTNIESSSAAFRVDHPSLILPSVLEPFQSTNVTVYFEPYTSGDHDGTLRISYMGDLGMEDLFVSLNGILILNEAQLHCSFLDAYYVPTFAGNTDSTSVTISNLGTAPGSIYDFYFGGDTYFHLNPDQEFPIVIEAGSSMDIWIYYSPLEPGVHTGSLHLSGVDFEHDITLHGQADAASLPNFSASTHFLDFGAVYLTGSETGYVTITNIGSAPGYLNSAFISSPFFVISTIPTLPYLLYPSDSLRIEVTYSPSEVMVNEGFMMLEGSNDYSDEISLWGEGIEHSTGDPNIELSESWLGFGTVALATEAFRSFYIRNTGTANAVINQMIIGGEPDFDVASLGVDGLASLPYILAPNDSLLVNVVFYSASPGYFDASLTIYDDMYNTYFVHLTAHIVEEEVDPVAIIEFSPSYLLFQDTFLSYQSTKTLWIKNTGTAYATIVESYFERSPDFGFFEASLRSDADRVVHSIQIAPGDSISKQISFTPHTAGVHTGLLIFVDENAQSYPLPLSGTGIYRPGPAIDTTPNPVVKTIVEQNSEVVAVKIWNPGDSTLTYNINPSAIPAWLTFQSPLVGSIASGAVGYITMTLNTTNLAPTPAGTPYSEAYSAMINIQNNSSDTPLYILEVYLVVTPQPFFVDFVGTPLQGYAPLAVRFTDLSRLGPDMANTTLSGWRWDFNNDGVTDSFQRNPLYTFSQPGTYSVKLTVTASNGQVRTLVKPAYITADAAIPIVANPLNVINDMTEDVAWGPYPLLANSTNPNGIFSHPAGLPLTFSAQSSQNIAVTIMGNFFTLNPSPDWHGTQTVVLTATDPFGMSASNSILVSVASVNDTPRLMLPPMFYYIRGSHFTINFADYIDDPDNPDEELSIFLTPVGQVLSSYEYHPINSPGIQGQLQVTFFSAVPHTDLPDFFMLTVSDNYGRSIAVGELSITVLNAFNPDYRIMNDIPISFAGQTVHFRDNTLGNPNTWLWELYRGPVQVESSNLKNPSFTLNTPDTYTLRLYLGHTEPGLFYDALFPDLFTLSGTAVDDDNLPDTWTQTGSPYNLFGGVDIPADVTVTVEPNVVINFFNETPLEIQGSIFAQNAIFQSQSSNGLWGGLLFFGNAGRNPSNLQDCSLINAIEPIKVINASPLLSNINIAPSDTTITMTGSGIQLLGNSSANISNVEILNYKTGIVLGGSEPGNRNTPTLSNVRVRNSDSASRTEAQDKTGIQVIGSSGAILNEVDITNYDIGLKLENEDDIYASTPTLSNVRIRNSDSASRNLKTGLYARGNVAFDALNLIIEEVNTGIDISGGSFVRDTPTLSNVRVRNSDSSARTNGLGIKLQNVASIILDDVVIENFGSGIDIVNSGIREFSTPTLSNVRVRNSDSSARAEDTGINIRGAVDPALNDVEIEDYNFGLKYDPDGAQQFGSTPTMTNVRIRNSNSGSRNPRIGLQLNNIVRCNLDDLEIEGYNIGLEILNTRSRDISTPTLSNVRVRNSDSSARPENIGIFLASGIRGSLKNSRVETAGIGILVADGNKTELKNNLLKNCFTGIKASGQEIPYPITRHYFHLEPLFASMHQDQVFKAIDVVFTGPWLIRNNTIYGYPIALNAQNAVVSFINNIVWNPQGVVVPFQLSASSFGNNYNNISFVNGVYPGPGNFNLPPLFIDPAMDNFALPYNSPCIDAGNPAFVDSDGSVSDVGAFVYLHNAAFRSDKRFVQTGTVVNFTNESMGHDVPGVTNVEWILGEQFVASTDRNWSHQFDTPGIYKVSLRMYTGNLLDTKVVHAAVVVQDNLLKAPENLSLAVNNANINLSWNAVTETIDDVPVSVNFYVIYSSDDPMGFYDYVGFTEGGILNYVHPGAANAPRRFYIVLGFEGSRADLMQYLADNPRINIR